jgi:hypothetical protein
MIAGLLPTFSLEQPVFRASQKPLSGATLPDRRNLRKERFA